MRIVLTGHKGFIGSHYYKYVKDDNEVNAYDLIEDFDLKDKSKVDSMPDCDVVIHMAATNGTRLFYETPTDVTFNNTLPTFNIVDRYKDTPTKIVFTSTCEIFNGTIDKGLYDIPTDEQVPIMFEDITKTSCVITFNIIFFVLNSINKLTYEMIFLSRTIYVKVPNY